MEKKHNQDMSFAFCQDLEKRDVNQIYGDYYFTTEGERQESIMEVAMDFKSSSFYDKKLKPIFFFDAYIVKSSNR